MDGYDPQVDATAAVPGGHLLFDDERVLFRLDAVTWRAGDETGQWTIPPCLRTGQDLVPVDAEVIELSRSSGSGRYAAWQVLSITCPASG